MKNILTDYHIGLKKHEEEWIYARNGESAMQRKCKCCGEEFIIRNSKALFCSDRCRITFWRKGRMNDKSLHKQ